MATYELTMPATMSLYFTIDADSEEEALAKVWDEDFSIICKGAASIGDFEMTEEVSSGNVCYAVLNSYEIEEIEEI